MEKVLSEKKSYRQILKSTSIMGGSSLIIIILRMIRTKFLAVMLGPSGVGLLGIYESVCNVIGAATGFGIGGSGVRQIAEAYGTDDQVKIARTVRTLRRTAIFSGLAGTCCLLFLSAPISELTFGDAGHARELALLAVTLFFTEVSGAQGALINGVRRIKDLAMLGILGALLGTVLSVPIVYALGERGIILLLITVSGTSVLTSWWYSRKIKVMPVVLSWRETLAEAKPLLKLGLAFMSSGLMTMGTMYLLRVFIVRSIGLDGAGIYQAAAGLSLLYTNFILDAMARDYYPRLTAVAGDNRECNSLINKQMEVGVLLAVPGIIGTMTFAPYVISLFYSQKFLPAVAVLQWQILGILLRVMTWPMSYMFLAKGNGKLFFWTELFANATHLCLVWSGLALFGLPGAGMAFFGMYLLYCLLIYRIVRTSYAFEISSRNMQVIAFSIIAAGSVFVTPYLLPRTAAFVMNVLVTIAAGTYAFKAILAVAGQDVVPEVLLRVKSYFRRG